MNSRVKRRPIAILVDRSKDVFSAGALVGLEPDDEFLSTDSRRRLTPRLLSAYDVVVICGKSISLYRKDELAALRRFVRQGGGLMLATSTAEAERETGCPAKDQTANQVGRLFGIRFLSSQEARERLKPDVHGVPGFERRDLSLRAVGPPGALKLRDFRFSRPSPIKVPGGSRVLIASRKTGEPVMALLRYGKGKVLAAGDQVLLASPVLTLAEMVWLVAPRKRRRKERPPTFLDVQRETVRRGDIRVSYVPSARGQVDTVFRLVRTIRGELVKLFSADKVPPCRIKLEPGAWGRRDWRGEKEVHLVLGSALTEARLAAHIGQALGSFFIDKHPVRHVMGYFQWQAAYHYLALRSMEWAGLKEEAARRRTHYHSKRKVDLSQVYPGARHSLEEERHVLNLFTDLEMEFGPRAFEKVLKVIPKKNPRAGFYHQVFGDEDVLAYYLALALGEKAYTWFEKRGTTVQRLPLVGKPRGRKFKQAVRDFLCERFTDPGACASDRFAAALALIQAQGDAKVSLDETARQTRSKKLSKRIPSAMRLAICKDKRGRRVLCRVLDSEDVGLAAIAAAVLVETGDTSCAPRLAKLARKLDARFQLAARYVLEQAGYKEARELPLDKLKEGQRRPAASLRVEHDGDLKVFPTVEGQEVANVFSARRVNHLPYNTHISTLYIDWVHTSRRFRRRGLARWAMEHTMSHPWERATATSDLWTGTDNVAHALYRSVGFVDIYRSKRYARTLVQCEKVELPKGIRVRKGAPGDEPGAVELMNECYQRFAGPRRRASGWPREAVVKLAWKKRELMGYARAHVDGDSARLVEFALKDMKKGREEIGAGLFAALHNALFRRGVKKVNTYDIPDDDFSQALIGQAGYAARPSGRPAGVFMSRVNDLARLFLEMTPLLEHRLREKKWHHWQGSITIAGKRLAATLIIKKGRMQVRKDSAPNASIRLTGSDRVLSEIVFGVRTAFDAYLQLDLRIAPVMTAPVRSLLTSLFPKVPNVWF